MGRTGSQVGVLYKKVLYIIKKMKKCGGGGVGRGQVGGGVRWGGLGGIRGGVRVDVNEEFQLCENSKKKIGGGGGSGWRGSGWM